MSQVPPQIVLFGQNFNLYGATLWNGGHYACTFYFNNGWFLYDGHREHTQKDSGVIFSSGPFTEPPGYSLSYLIYCKYATVFV